MIVIIQRTVVVMTTVDAMMVTIVAMMDHIAVMMIDAVRGVMMTAAICIEMTLLPVVVMATPAVLPLPMLTPHAQSAKYMATLK
jgi:hypothetical protein